MPSFLRWSQARQTCSIARKPLIKSILKMEPLLSSHDGPQTDTMGIVRLPEHTIADLGFPKEGLDFPQAADTRCRYRIGLENNIEDLFLSSAVFARLWSRWLSSSLIRSGLGNCWWRISIARNGIRRPLSNKIRERLCALALRCSQKQCQLRSPGFGGDSTLARHVSAPDYRALLVICWTGHPFPCSRDLQHSTPTRLDYVYQDVCKRGRIWSHVARSSCLIQAHVDRMVSGRRWLAG